MIEAHRESKGSHRINRVLITPAIALLWVGRHASPGRAHPSSIRVAHAVVLLIEIGIWVDTAVHGAIPAARTGRGFAISSVPGHAGLDGRARHAQAADTPMCRCVRARHVPFEKVEFEAVIATAGV